jgi:hypothetical protein
MGDPIKKKKCASLIDFARNAKSFLIKKLFRALLMSDKSNFHTSELFQRRRPHNQTGFSGLFRNRTEQQLRARLPGGQKRTTRLQRQDREEVLRQRVPPDDPVFGQVPLDTLQVRREHRVQGLQGGVRVRAQAIGV